MAWILLFLALAWIIVGSLLILRTDSVRTVSRELLPASRLRLLAGPTALFGAILVFGAFLSERFFWWPFVLGVLALGKAYFFFRTPEEDLRRRLESWWAVSDETLRLGGLLTFSLGAALLGYLF